MNTLYLSLRKISPVSILTAILLFFIFTIAYGYAHFKTRKNYLNYFNFCQEKMRESQSQIEKIPEAQECLKRGGCFELCGSPCTFPKPTIKLSELLNFYFGKFQKPKPCPTFCARRCLPPLK